MHIREPVISHPEMGGCAAPAPKTRTPPVDTDDRGLPQPDPPSRQTHRQCHYGMPAPHRATGKLNPGAPTGFSFSGSRQTNLQFCPVRHDRTLRNINIPQKSSWGILDPFPATFDHPSPENSKSYCSLPFWHSLTRK
jgi:hypothetical protein